MSFSALGLSPAFCDALTRLGYAEPTPVQQQAIPVALSGRDLIARAQTGTGKTAAFGLPMMTRLLAPASGGSRRNPRALVLVPTRELALQVHRALVTYASSSRIRVTSIYGGVGMGAQIKELRLGTDIVVATPGRLIDHLDRRTVDLSGLQVLTLDEADRMLDMGFMPALRRVMASVPAVRQTLLFSATLPEAVLKLSSSYTTDPARVDVSTDQVVATTVTHAVHPVTTERKRALLTHVLTENAGSQALVFCRTKHGSDRVAEHLTRTGLKATVIHGNKTQGARNRALADFKSGRASVLVATDIAARGLDIAHLPLVVNYDLPLVAEDYVHRVGRTGRAGRDGRAVSLVSSDEASLLRDIQRLLPVPIAQVAVPGFEAPSVVMAEPDARRGRPRQPHRGNGAGAGRIHRRGGQPQGRPAGRHAGGSRERGPARRPFR